MLGHVVGRRVAGLKWRLCGLWRGAIGACMAAESGGKSGCYCGCHNPIFVADIIAGAGAQSCRAPIGYGAGGRARDRITRIATVRRSIAPAPIAPIPVAPMPAAPPGTSPVAQAAPAIPAGQVLLAVAARYGQNAAPITAGLIWRIYAAKPNSPGNFRLIKEDRGAAPTFTLPPGNYVVHASLGLASAAKTIVLRADTVREVFDIPAGGIRLEGRVGDVRIPLGHISFEIFTGSQFSASERRPIAQNVQAGDVVLLPEGTYYIVSNYGDGNSVVRSDVHIDPGKLTDIVVTHRAAIITLKLVNNPQRRGACQYAMDGLDARRRRDQGIDRRLSPSRAGRRRLSHHRPQ